MSQYFVINAGRKKIGDVGYDNYVGQIKPADMSAIIWYGASGDDTTGDGSFANPYLTFARSIDDLSSAKSYILETSLNGRYEPTSKIYWDPAAGNDANNGLTPATAKKTYASAALAGAYTAVIEVIGNVTMLDSAIQPTQGQIGYTLIYAGKGFAKNSSVLLSTDAMVGFSAVIGNGKYVAVVGKPPFSGTPAQTLRIVTSPDLVTFTETDISTEAASDRIGYGNPSSTPTFVIAGTASVSPTPGITPTKYSTDDGATWTNAAGGFGVRDCFDIQFIQNYFLLGFSNPIGGNVIKRSADGITWVDPTSYPTNLTTALAIAGNGTDIIAVVTGTARKLIYSSDAGDNWIDKTATFDPSGFTEIPNKAAYGNGRWLVFAQGAVNRRLYFSTNPSTTWTSADVTDKLGGWFIKDVKYHAGSDLMLLFMQKSGLDMGIFGVDASGNITLIYFSTFTAADEIAAMGSPDIGYVNGEYRVVWLGGASDYQPFPSRLRVSSLLDSPSSLTANLTNAEIDVAANTVIEKNLSLTNITSNPTTGKSIVSSAEIDLKNCDMRSVDDAGVEVTANKSKISGCIIKSAASFNALLITGVAAVQDDIEIIRNTIIGNFELANTGGTNKELIQDNIIEGNAIAAELTDMKSGNLRGAVSNFNMLPTVSEVDPLFVDSVNYRPQRELLGAIFDSYMIQRSTFYINGAGDAADLGAWSSLAANVQYIYMRSFNFLLPSKPDTVAQVKHNRANLKVSENGTPDVVNTPTGRWEEIVLNYGALPQLADYLANHIEFVDWMESLIDMTCQIAMDANYSPATAVVASAASAIDDPFIDIVAANIRSGDRITVSSREYSVIYVINGTRLVLSEPLRSAVSISQSIPVKSPVGYGEYQYVPQQERKLSRWLFDRVDYIRGLQLRFVRKWQ